MYRSFAVVAVLACGCGAGLEDAGPGGGASAQELRVEEAESCGPHRVLVCHLRGHAPWPQAICVGLNALHGHLEHEDSLGDCPQIGTPPHAEEEGGPWMPRVPKAPAQLAGGSGSDEDWTPTVPKAPVQVCAAAGSACHEASECCDGLACSAGLCMP